MYFPDQYESEEEDEEESMAEYEREVKERSLERMAQRECGFCRAVSRNLKKCGSCKVIYYCGEDCQKKHWRTHKKSCGQPGRGVASPSGTGDVGDIKPLLLVIDGEDLGRQSTEEHMSGVYAQLRSDFCIEKAYTSKSAMLYIDTPTPPLVVLLVDTLAADDLTLAKRLATLCKLRVCSRGLDSTRQWHASICMRLVRELHQWSSMESILPVVWTVMGQGRLQPIHMCSISDCAFHVRSHGALQHEGKLVVWCCCLRCHSFSSERSKDPIDGPFYGWCACLTGSSSNGHHLVGTRKVCV
eukprot:TRINITY_DN287_c0_g1_i3.p1 TRINITY_DN287_c0_g1~~TRINITY_DN287_c0_g1_i3.p1  ORF type:complete len:325 (-),score=17.51 TRINITY_DN287_c0_g1_i3:255-1151(-)